jgi:hypothetical protein
MQPRRADRHGAVVLSRFAGEVVTEIERIELPASRLKGAKVNAAEADLRERRAGLDAQLKSVAREVREAQTTLDEKTRAITGYDEVFGGGATMLTGLLRLAGKPELAAKVRPSSRRPGQTEIDAGDAAPTPISLPEP